MNINRNLMQIQKEVFLFNNRLVAFQQSMEINKWSELIIKDKEIVLLRESIRKTTKVQMENGTATATDYARELNAEDQARQNLVLHETQMLMAQYAYKTTVGNNQTADK